LVGLVDGSNADSDNWVIKISSVLHFTDKVKAAQSKSQGGLEHMSEAIRKYIILLYRRKPSGRKMRSTELKNDGG
jgi:hypothetical protein